MELTKEQKQDFKKRVYEPYTEAWNIMKTLRDAENYSQETWDKYMAKCYEFQSKYPSDIGSSIFRVMIDCGSEVGKIAKK